MTIMLFYHSAEGKSVRVEDTVQSPADNRNTVLVLSVTAEMLEPHRCKLVDKVDIRQSGLYQEVGKHWCRQEPGSLALA